MPGWVLNITTFSAFNLGFSVVFWVMIVLILPVIIIATLIKNA